jgi:hypothetical protein
VDVGFVVDGAEAVGGAGTEAAGFEEVAAPGDAFGFMTVTTRKSFSVMLYAERALPSSRT